jgi:hypothetical protein
MSVEAETLTMDDARDVRTAERKKLAAKGQALPGGGFPIKTVGDLKNAIQAFGRAKDKARTKALIIRRAKALGATNLLPDGWLGKKKADKADADDGAALIDCPECARAFLHEVQLLDHAEAVHTFSDVERIVNEAVRERFGKKRTASDKNYIYLWINDIAEDWCVFTVEGNAASTTYKIPYTLGGDDNLTVTLGDPYEVRRRTVWDKVEGSTKKGEP